MKFPRITIYDRYIFSQVFFATFVAILLFTVVWIAPEMLLNTIKRTLEGVYTAKTAVLVLTYELPKILGKAFPVGLLLGTCAGICFEFNSYGNLFCDLRQAYPVFLQQT